MSRNGWIRVDRKILENPDVTYSSEYFHVWLWLLLNAAHEPETVFVNGQAIELDAGQLVSTTKEISEKTGVPFRATRSALSRFVSRHMIAKETTAKTSVISIVNWQSYQGNPPHTRHIPATTPPDSRIPTLLNKTNKQYNKKQGAPKLSDITCDHYRKEDDSAALWRLLNEMEEEN